MRPRGVTRATTVADRVRPKARTRPLRPYSGARTCIYIVRTCPRWHPAVYLLIDHTPSLMKGIRRRGSCELNGDNIQAQAMGASPLLPALRHFKKSRAISQVWRTSNGSLASARAARAPRRPRRWRPSSAHSCRSIASSAVSRDRLERRAAGAPLSWPKTYAHSRLSNDPCGACAAARSNARCRPLLRLVLAVVVGVLEPVGRAHARRDGQVARCLSCERALGLYADVCELVCGHHCRSRLPWVVAGRWPFCSSCLIEHHSRAARPSFAARAVRRKTCF